MIVPLEKFHANIKIATSTYIHEKHGSNAEKKKKNQVEGFTADLNTQDNLKMNEKCNVYPF